MRRDNGEGSWGKRQINGSEYFRFSKIYNGKRKEFYGKTKKEVNAKVKNFEESLEQKTSSLDTSFQDLMYDWLLNVRINEVADNTYTINIREFERLIQGSFLGGTLLCDLSHKDIQLFINNMAKKYARTTIKRVYNLIHKFCQYLQLTNLVGNDLCNGVTIPSENIVAKKKKDIAFFDTEQLKMFCKEVDRKNEVGNAINGKPGTNVYGSTARLLVVIAYTGLRYAEAVALKWSDIDFENKTMSITKAIATKTDPVTGEKQRTIKEPKYNSKRIVPLSDKAIEALEYLRKNQPDSTDDDFISTVNSTTLNKSLKSINKRAGLPTDNFSLHSLRHSFGSVLLEQGVSMKVISTLLGHKDISTTANIYVSVTDKLVSESINVLNKI